LPQDPAYRMRAICRFPPPDSHVSLSAVLAPGPNAQLATPPRPTTGQSNLPQNREAPQPKPTPIDTPRHHNPPRPQTRPPTLLPDCRTTQTVTSLRPGTQPLRPSPASSTSPHRQSAKTRDLHAPSKSTQSATPPAPAICERKPNRLRELFPPQAPASAPIRRSTSKAPNRPGQHCDPDTARVLAPTLCFSTCAATYQLKTLTEQGACEHYLAFSRR
jgi:hypothetical protein